MITRGANGRSLCHLPRISKAPACGWIEHQPSLLTIAVRILRGAIKMDALCFLQCQSIEQPAGQVTKRVIRHVELDSACPEPAPEALNHVRN
jgi:hypothetical protein